MNRRPERAEQLTIADEDAGVEQSGVRSIETGMRILSAFIGLGSEPMLKTLAERAGMHPAKAHRYLVSFSRSGFVERNPMTGRYRLGPMALRLGSSALQNIDVVRSASPLMHAVCEDMAETVALAIWVRYGPVIVRVEEPIGPTTVTTHVGTVLPLLSSATGQVFAAFLPRRIVQPLLEREIRAGRRNQPAPVATMEEADQMLEEVRRQGLGRVAGGVGPGINALSAPIFDHSGSLVASLSSLGAAGRFDNSWDGDLARKLRVAARGLSGMLGFDDGQPVTNENQAKTSAASPSKKSSAEARKAPRGNLRKGS